ncbi:hypothetical protein L211DRAFT_876952 [Terfezia boudieri ATCC MYA-4762]|uniref:Uncharacterized protein n=1 Tax=Terfezia boudieri ATCC MYA-4762 TaxID=1051890 RepID=A0A3N4M483_9PEZI|nr:hypothetical protein L211DRAFT_876952 [Terfezia boudieri ATCC MYA-4762]
MQSDREVTSLYQTVEITRADIHAHKLALERTIRKIPTQLDAFGFKRPNVPSPAWLHEAIPSQSVVLGLETLAPVLDTCNQMQKSEDRRRPVSRELHLKDKGKKSEDTKLWVLGTSEASNMTADQRLVHPDPDGDSEAETTWNHRIYYEDLPKSCNRGEWLAWGSKAWNDYSSLKAEEKELQQTLEDIVADYNSLVSNGILNNYTLNPSEYGTRFKQKLDDMSKEMSDCRKLRSRVHELLPAFEWSG